MADFFIADDLSGALDAAAAFHQGGRRVRIRLDGSVGAPAGSGDVIGITTETRNDHPEAAAAKLTATLTAATAARGGHLLCKKIDSTLRGPVGAELRSLLSALPDAHVLLAPANPSVGRTVRNGVLLVNGVPVAETAFGRDPVYPLRSSDVREILRTSGDLDSGALSRIVIPDVSSDADLADAVAAIAAQHASWIPVGSGARAKVVARQARARTAPADPGLSRNAAPAPVLFVAGSAHPLNRQQADALVERTAATVHEIDLANPRHAGRAARAALDVSAAAILRLPETRTAAGLALRAVTEAALAALEDGHVRHVFATGGESAFALCVASSVSELDYLAEIEPGLSLSRDAAKPHGIVLACKPGGFGDRPTWLRAYDALRSA
jgi:uncharacterized protein YgbK (DUF1537 family)